MTVPSPPRKTPKAVSSETSPEERTPKEFTSHPVRWLRERACSYMLTQSLNATQRPGRGVRCGRKRVARLMRIAGLHGIHRRCGKRARPAKVEAAELSRDAEPDRWLSVALTRARYAARREAAATHAVRTWSVFSCGHVHRRGLLALYRRLAGVALAAYRPRPRRPRAGALGAGGTIRRARPPHDRGVQYLSIRYTERHGEAGSDLRFGLAAAASAS